MPDSRIRRIVIVGGGTAGWMAAAALRHFLNPAVVGIELVESEDIGTIGVGEATLPAIRAFNAQLGIGETDFIRETRGAFKLGIEFQDWGTRGNRFFHGFGDFGAKHKKVAAYQLWLMMQAHGERTDLEEYSIAAIAARLNRFSQPHPDQRSPLAAFSYAYHFDATLYAHYLRRFAEKRGVRRTNARVVDVRLNGESGFIESVVLDNGMTMSGDFFIDCSGFAGLLIEKALRTGFEDWSRWLPCNRAVAVPCAAAEPFAPYTRATARDAGWQWRIPLQHRTGNGHVYCSAFVDDDTAVRTLLDNLEGRALRDPLPLRFTTGRRRKFWNRNCLAVGLAGGFVEPLESSSILLIQQAIGRLLEFFPDTNFDPAVESEYNRQAALEFERIRDFLILHYKLNARHGEPFWDHCRSIEVPEALALKIEVFRSRGHAVIHEADSFLDPSWISMFHGLGVTPAAHDPLADQLDISEVRDLLAERRSFLLRAVQSMPTQAAFVAKHCQAPGFAAAGS
jgi:tryptophan halogenase